MQYNIDCILQQNELHELVSNDYRRHANWYEAPKGKKRRSPVKRELEGFCLCMGRVKCLDKCSWERWARLLSLEEYRSSDKWIHPVWSAIWSTLTKYVHSNQKSHLIFLESLKKPTLREITYYFISFPLWYIYSAYIYT